MNSVVEAESEVYRSPQRLQKKPLRICPLQYRPWMAKATGKMPKLAEISCHHVDGGAPSFDLDLVCRSLASAEMDPIGKDFRCWRKLKPSSRRETTDEQVSASEQKTPT